MEKQIKCKIDCFTTDPAMNWIGGNVVEVSNEIAEKLLINKNFVLVKEVSIKDTTNTETENDDSIHRTKRSNRNRD